MADRLGAVLQKMLHERGITLTRAAQDLGINPNSVRSWVSQNRFPEEELLRLAELAGLPPNIDSLQKKYEIKLTKSTRRTTFLSMRQRSLAKTDNLHHVFDAMDLKVEQLQKLYEDFGQDVQALFESMQKDDLFIYLSVNELPYEWSEQKLIGCVSKAIKNKAHFIYICPDIEILDNLKDSGLTNVLDPGIFGRRLRLFKESLKLAGRSAGEIEAHVHTLGMKSIAFLAPEHKYVLFIPTDSVGTYRALARFPVGAKNRRRDLHLPLPDSVATQLYQVVQVATRNHPKLAKLLLGGNGDA